MGLMHDLRLLFMPRTRFYFDKGGAPTPPAPPDPNVQIAAEGKANRYNVNSPFGSSQWTGPTAGENTVTQTLSPAQQRQLAYRNMLADTMLGNASNRAGNLPNSPFNFGEATPDVAKAQYEKNVSLLQPQFERMDKDFEQRMTNSGIPVGSDAYNEALRAHESNKNTALTGLAKDATTQGTQLGLQQRQENLNEIAQLMGGSQLQPLTPAGGGSVDASSAFANQQAGLNRQYQGQLAGYNADVGQQNNMMGGMFSLGTAAIMA